MRRAGSWSTPWSRWLGLAFVLLVVLVPRFAAAVPAAVPDQPRPVIVPGREQEVLALLQPHALGQDLASGWALHSVSIDVGTITVWVAGPDDGHARLTLDHRDYGPPDARMLAGFALKVTEQPEGSEAAMRELIAVIERNDDGSFWGRDVALAGEPREHPYDSRWSEGSLLGAVRAWSRDGVTLFGVLMLTLLGLVAHKLRGAQPWMKWALLCIVVLAAALRLALSPAVALAPWPYTRVLSSARMLFHGPGLAAIHPGPMWLSETIIGSTLAFSIVAPLAVYVHTRYLLDDHRAGLFAALIIAILPLHLRFSHSDTAFIPSITVSSVVFALIHVATRESSKVGGWVAIVLVAAPLALLYDVRPLNIMYYPLLLATAVVNRGLRTEKPTIDRVRTAAMFVVISAVTFGIGVPRLLEHFGAQVDEGMSLDTLSAGLWVIVSPRFNALINPVFSPPGLILLAVVGAVDLWRRGRRRLFWFIVSWMVGLLVAHAYVVPKSMYMQARYHLHLVVPYSLLVVCGLDAGLRWLAHRRDQGWSWLAGRRYALVRAGGMSYVLASPLIHAHGIGHVEFNDVHEWLFVHELRHQIPAGCTIAEYTGPRSNRRFARVGSWVGNGVPQERWPVVEIRAPKGDEPVISDDVRELLGDPPDCLYWYEGLPCFGNKSASESKAPVCRAIEGLVDLKEVATRRFKSEMYDENLGAGLGDIEHVQLRLYRARAKH